MAFLFPLNIKPHLDELKGQSKYNWFPQPQGPVRSDSNSAVENAGFLVRFNETTGLTQRGFTLKKPYRQKTQDGTAKKKLVMAETSYIDLSNTRKPKLVRPHGEIFDKFDLALKDS